MDKEKIKGKNTVEATDDKSLLKPVLVPNKSVSVFKLGDDISNYFWLKYDYRQKNKDLEYDTDSYNFWEIPVIIWTDEETDKKIEVINCDDSCIWNGTELIGMPYAEFLETFGLKADKHDNLYSEGPKIRGRNYDVYDFEDLGLMIWVWRKKIRTVLALTYLEDE